MGTIWKKKKQRRRKKNGKNEREDLTLTGLLMEGADSTILYDVERRRI